MKEINPPWTRTYTESEIEERRKQVGTIAKKFRDKPEKQSIVTKHGDVLPRNHTLTRLLLQLFSQSDKDLAYCYGNKVALLSEVLNETGSKGLIHQALFKRNTHCNYRIMFLHVLDAAHGLSLDGNAAIDLFFMLSIPNSAEFISYILETDIKIDVAKNIYLLSKLLGDYKSKYFRFKLVKEQLNLLDEKVLSILEGNNIYASTENIFDDIDPSAITQQQHSTYEFELLEEFHHAVHTTYFDGQPTTIQHGIYQGYAMIKQTLDS